MKIQISFVAALICAAGAAMDRPADLVYSFQGANYGIFDPASSYYLPDREAITSTDVDDNLKLLKFLSTHPNLKAIAVKADPSLGSLIDNTKVYSALATRYRYEPVMQGTVPGQEPSGLSLVARTIRHQSQSSAWARAVRNRFRSVVDYVAAAMPDILSETSDSGLPYTIGNLGGAAGDDVSAAISQATQGQGTTRVRQLIYDIDANAMELGVELGKSHYHYDVEARPNVNLIDPTQLPAISASLRSENVRWINSIGFFMEYEVSGPDGKNLTHADRESLFRAYCQGGVERISFSAYQSTPLPQFMVNVGWKDFDLSWTPVSIVQLMQSAGYTLDKLDTDELPLMQNYYFKGNCP